MAPSRKSSDNNKPESTQYALGATQTRTLPDESLTAAHRTPPLRYVLPPNILPSKCLSLQEEGKDTMDDLGLMLRGFSQNHADGNDDSLLPPVLQTLTFFGSQGPSHHLHPLDQPTTAVTSVISAAVAESSFTSSPSQIPRELQDCYSSDVFNPGRPLPQSSAFPDSSQNICDGGNAIQPEGSPSWKRAWKLLSPKKRELELQETLHSEACPRATCGHSATGECSGTALIKKNERLRKTRAKVKIALRSIGATALGITHELLEFTAEAAELTPIPGLAHAAKALLNVWDALQSVSANDQACQDLTSRCAENLFLIRSEIYRSGDHVAENLVSPIEKLTDSFQSVHAFIVKQNKRASFTRYLKRDEYSREIEKCEKKLNESMQLFMVQIMIRVCRTLQANMEEQKALGLSTPDAMKKSLMLVSGPTEDNSTPAAHSASYPLGSSPATTTECPVIPSPPDVLCSSPLSESESFIGLAPAMQSLGITEDGENLRALLLMAKEEMFDITKIIEQALRKVDQEHNPSPVKVSQDFNTGFGLGISSDVGPTSSRRENTPDSFIVVSRTNSGEGDSIIDSIVSSLDSLVSSGMFITGSNSDVGQVSERTAERDLNIHCRRVSDMHERENEWVAVA